MVAVVAMAPAATAAPEPEESLSTAACNTAYKVWLANVGSWSPQSCDGQDAGTEGQSRAIEKLILAANWTKLCVQGHVEGIGDQAWNCHENGYAATAGTQGQSRRLEGVHIHSKGGGAVCAQAHVQDVGWQQVRCGNEIWVGTSGQGKRMEKIRIWRQ